MTYRTYNLLVRINGVAKFFDGFCAVDLEAALNDIREVFVGEVELIQYRVL